MFPYRVKYTESEYDIQNIDLLYKIDQQMPKYFRFVGNVWNVLKKSEIKKIERLFCILCKLHNSYFVFFVYFVYFVYFVFSLFIVQREFITVRRNGFTRWFHETVVARALRV